VICSGLRVCSFKACKKASTHPVSVEKKVKRISSVLVEPLLFSLGIHVHGVGHCGPIKKTKYHATVAKEGKKHFCTQKINDKCI